MRFVLNPLTGLLDRVNQLNIGEFVQGGTVGSVLFIDANGLVGESNPGLTYDGTDLTIVGDLTVNTLNYTTLNPAIDLSGRATTELDNLGTVAINTSLISDTDSTDDLGSSSLFWRKLFVDVIRLQSGANNFIITDDIGNSLVIEDESSNKYYDINTSVGTSGLFTHTFDKANTSGLSSGSGKRQGLAQFLGWTLNYSFLAGPITIQVTNVEFSRYFIRSDTALTVNKATNLLIEAPFNDSNVTIVDTSAIRITNRGAGDNQFGIYIENLTAGSSNDYGLYIAGADTYAIWVDAGVSRFDGNIITGEDSTNDIGDSSNFFKDLYIDNIVGPTTFNEAGADKDFRFEGDTDQNLLFLNAGSDVITIGSATQLAKFGIDGNSDEIQFLVQGHSTQTSFLAVFEKSDGTDVVTIDNDGNLDLAGRLLGNKGVDVASATDITLGLGNYFDITGTTQIDTIAATGWTAGSVVTLQFDASVTVKHNTAGTGAVMLLAGAVDFAATVGDTLSFVFDGTAFRELARTTI